jgi:Zn-dependent peptidase ImmA (M78 family)/DNA-binding XRE family transcriptional regulator
VLNQHIEKINPTRLTFARKRRGYRKNELAEQIGVDVRSITGYELGETEPRRDIFIRLQSALGFPEGFFCGPNLDEPTEQSASFRALSKMSAKHRDMALTQGGIAFLFSRWLESRFELPAVSVPDLRYERSPKLAADAVRRMWGVGELPIRNVIHLLESKGVRVFSLAIEAREVDAFSLWREETPFVFLNNQKSPEHSRFDAAHELGHLVLHRHGAPQGREAENEANDFASAFLMPEGSVLANPPSLRPTIEELIKLKKIWGVSLSALTYRMHELNLLTDWQSRSLFIQMSKRGYLTEEPSPGRRECSLVLPKLLQSLHQDEGMTRSRIAAALNIPVSELEQLLFGLVMTGINGGRLQSSANRPSVPLTRVK